MGKKKYEEPGLSLNVIIVAVIALIVLVVLIFVFTGRIHPLGDYYYCMKNPDECACETWRNYGLTVEKGKTYTTPDCDYIENNTCIIRTNCVFKLNCLTYRKLTEQELMAQDCTENPRDDEECVCVKHGQEQVTISYDVRYFIFMNESDYSDFGYTCDDTYYNFIDERGLMISITNRHVIELAKKYWELYTIKCRIYDFEEIENRSVCLEAEGRLR